jgi:hypothetical protein
MAVQANFNKEHEKSRRNRSSLAKSAICACFYCFNEYPYKQIVEWIDNEKTALCPRCGIDAVVGFDSPAVDREMLRKLHDRWFGHSKRLTPEEWKTAIEKDAWPGSK